MKLTQVKFTLTATAKVEIILDAQTYEKLTEKELENIAIAKIEMKDITWVCDDLKDKEVDLTQISQTE